MHAAERSRWWRRATARILESRAAPHSVPRPCQPKQGLPPTAFLWRKIGLKKYDLIGLVSCLSAAPRALEAIQAGFATIRCKRVGREFEQRVNFPQLKMICN